MSSDGTRRTGAYVPPHRRGHAAAATASSASIKSGGGGPTSAAPAGARFDLPSRDGRRQYPHSTRRHPSSWDECPRPTDVEHNTDSSSIHSSRLVHDPHTRVCCINLASRPDKWRSVEAEARRAGGNTLVAKMERWEAVLGSRLVGQAAVLDAPPPHDSIDDWRALVQQDWDATKNAQYARRVTPGPRRMSAGEIGCALSHVGLWKSLLDQQQQPHSASSSTNAERMLVLEDDLQFTSYQGRPRFLLALDKALALLPDDWGILYLGFSSRGPRARVNAVEEAAASSSSSNPFDPPVELYQPTYGFHTHAYLLTTAAAARLVEALPVVGPLDVWLADNEWFGIPTYCSVIPNEGWYNEREQVYEGANLVSQQKQRLSSDVSQSAHS
jgi:GR25 family glycosyltransferase involved in LPS biosynthesis